MQSSLNILGNVAEFRVVLQVPSTEERKATGALEDFPIRPEGRVFEGLINNEDEIRFSINRIITKNLGEDFECQSMEIRRGSIEILYVIGTAYAVYQGISKYKNFLESLKIVQSQVEELLFREASQHSKYVKLVGSTMAPAPSLVNPVFSQTSIGSSECAFCKLLWLFAMYVLFSHAAFLGLLFYWIVRQQI